MKKYLNIIGYLFISIILCTSCVQYRYVTISGTPGTKIYNKNKNYVSTIGDDGTCSPKIHVETEYMLSKAPNNDIMVPFAINVKDCIDEADMFNYADGAGFSVTTMAYCWTFPLAPLYATVVWQEDKPLPSSTNNDLIK